MKRLLLASLLFLAGAVHGQTLTFTLETSSSDGKSVTPRLTWSTTPTGASCTASGATDWTGAKAAAGTQILSPVTSTRTYSLVCAWPGVSQAVISWSAPTTNTDGSAYSNPAGFRLVYGPAAGTLTQSIAIADPAARTRTVTGLAPGTWYFGLYAVNAQGLESALSNVASKVTTAGANQARSLELTIRFPNPPVITVE